MTIDYTYLLIALFLLWFPRQWLRIGREATRSLRWLRRSRRRSKDPTQIREPGDIRLRVTEEFVKPRNYIDFMRALLGGLIIVGNPDWGIGSCFEVPIQHTLTVHEEMTLVYVRMVIFLIGVAVQFIRFEDRVSFYAPIFFIAGISFSICGFNAGFFAFVIVWVMSSAAPISPASFLSAFALMVLMLGLLFNWDDKQNVAFMSILAFLPVLVSLLARRSLALFNKRVK